MPHGTDSHLVKTAHKKTKYTKAVEAIKKEKGITKKLVGIESLEKGAIPRKNYEVYSLDGGYSDYKK